MPNFQAITKISRKHKMIYITRRIETLVLNAPKNPYLNQATKKNTCQNFPTQKNPEIENFKPPKILRLSLSLEIRSTPPPAPGNSS